MKVGFSREGNKGDGFDTITQFFLFENPWCLKKDEKQKTIWELKWQECRV